MNEIFYVIAGILGGVFGAGIVGYLFIWTNKNGEKVKVIPI